MFYTNVEFKKFRHEFVLSIGRASQTKNRMDIDDKILFFCDVQVNMLYWIKLLS